MCFLASGLLALPNIRLSLDLGREERCIVVKHAVLCICVRQIISEVAIAGSVPSVS